MYVFKAVRWGRDIEETADTFTGLVSILHRWLVWDEDGGYMRCAPHSVTRTDNGKSVGSRFLYAFSRGEESVTSLRRALASKRGA